MWVRLVRQLKQYWVPSKQTDRSKALHTRCFSSRNNKNETKKKRSVSSISWRCLSDKSNDDGDNDSDKK